MQWCIKEGKKIKFWSDRWLDNDSILIDSAFNIQRVDVSSTVSDFITPDGNWDFPKVSSCLPNEAVLQVIGMMPSCAHFGEDSFAWGLEVNDQFSVKLVFLFIKDLESAVQGSLWSKVWRWEAPAKFKHFSYG
ncbi:hypothetical protein LINPERHAP2_LOCUS33201 [Linum perenne]